MKVVGINGSARADGNTGTIMQIVMKQLQTNNIECELIPLCNREIRPCKGCFACGGKKTCTAIKDDFQEVFAKLVQADGILLGSPVYSADISALMKAFLERAGVVAAVNAGLLRHKVGAVVAAVRRAGGLAAVDTMAHFLMNKEVLIVGSTYWNMVYGKEPGEVLRDKEGIENMENLGQNMAWLMKKLQQQ